VENKKMSDNEDVKDVKHDSRSSPEHSPRRKDDDDDDRVTSKKNNRSSDKEDDRDGSSDRRGGSDRKGDGETRKRVDDRPEDANRGSTSLLVRNLSYDVRLVSLLLFRSLHNSSLSENFNPEESPQYLLCDLSKTFISSHRT
jgi:hypothetical protein